jgi:hypothetical protein
MDTQKSRWSWIKPAFWGLVVGLIAGPTLSGYMGWQVLADTAKRNVQTAVVKQEAHTCALLAREHKPGADKLGYGQRHDLAQKYAKLPWSTDANYRVVDACADDLSAPATTGSSAPQGSGSASG